jgi:GNAT superfamily N-acetyltransferase
MRTLSIAGRPIVIRPAQWQELVDLRHVILRQGLPREAAVFEGDDLPSSRHCGAFCEGVAVGCATLLASRWEHEPAWQLRGMATAPELRGMGLGRAMLEQLESALVADAQADGTVPLLLWCNARVPAVRFYQNQRWAVISEQFEIPTAGPHVKMMKRLAPRPQGGL